MALNPPPRRHMQASQACDQLHMISTCRYMSFLLRRTCQTRAARVWSEGVVSLSGRQSVSITSNGPQYATFRESCPRREAPMHVLICRH